MKIPNFIELGGKKNNPGT